MTRLPAGPITRSLALAMTLPCAVATASAQTNVYYAERGSWWVMNTAAYCRAGNRPPEDFNGSPFNALQIVAGRESVIGVEVFFWPGLFAEGTDYKLALRFDNIDPVSLPAKPTMGDFALMSERTPNGDLWRALQKGRNLRVAVDGVPQELFFTLGDSAWLLNSLQQCVGLLPKP